jgi:hypothetical protein
VSIKEDASRFRTPSVTGLLVGLVAAHAGQAKHVKIINTTEQSWKIETARFLWRVASMGRIFLAERFASVEEWEKVSRAEPPTLLILATVLRSE